MDRTSFLGPSISTDVKAALPHFAGLPQPLARKLLPLILSYLNSPDHDNIPTLHQDISAIQKEADSTVAPTIPIVFTGLMYIIRLAIKSRVSVENFQNDLADIRIPQPIITDLVTVLKKSRGNLESSALENRLKFPTLTSLRWRVDVIISSSNLARVLTPLLTMQVTDSAGEIRTFELTIDRFHELRYNVAKVLKDMEELEQLQILKIDK
eukprot:TRINITY_DN2401_c0_g1_i1.p1 TRINITY_DN2401_c0_g1~~TRINITY_DN2401_c0_g1_i1.p1  ORF type:complete len:210 (+),score=33.90 TRINITY_DN2401_c0_g1_i1:173-802(+)